MTPPARSWIDNDNGRPAWLDLAHKKLDATAAAAYGWPADLSDEQLLERLLALNLARAAAEVESAKAKKPRTTRDMRTDELVQSRIPTG